MSLSDVFEIAKISFHRNLFLNAIEHFSSVIFHSIENTIIVKSLLYRGACYAALGLIKRSLHDNEEFLKSIQTFQDESKGSSIFYSLSSILKELQRHINNYTFYGNANTVSFEKLVSTVRKIQEIFTVGSKQQFKSASTLSYTQRLLRDFRASAQPNAVLATSIKGVSILSNTDLRISLSRKITSHKWTITIRCQPQRTLHRVALLHDQHLSHFHIDSIYDGSSKVNVPSGCHDWEGLLAPIGMSADNAFTFHLTFNSEMYGTYNQTLVVDFGSRPALGIPIAVETKFDSDSLSNDSLVTMSQGWDDRNCEIVKLSDKTLQLQGSEIDKILVQNYKMPNLNTRILDVPLSEHTYIERMHVLLFLEENAQFSHLHSRCSKCSLKMESSFMLSGKGNTTGSKFARPGEIFAKLTLPVSLSVDNVVGSIIEKSVSTVLIKPISQNEGSIKPTVYEAIVEEKTLQNLYLRMSNESIEGLNMSTEKNIEVSVQFQLNRIPFCRMHHVLESLPNVCVLFPPLLAHYIQLKPLSLEIESSLDPLLNTNQRKALCAAVCDVSVPGTELWFPPVVISGPFGTGKTFTLAQIALTLTKQENTRVLICTHSNSAADLYIKDYLHNSVLKGNINATPLRIMYEHRWPKTVPEAVYHYSLPSNSADTYFARPTLQDIMRHRIIVTTLSTTKYLHELNMPKGTFTHILLDEAAQALECEVIAPLVLMSAKTRIVIAGDHRQLSPLIRCRLAIECDFDISFLQRLFKNYPDTSPFRILLTENYRSHADIVQFASDWFYDSLLSAKGVHTAHHKFKPITFFAARGEERQETNSTSFFNISEAMEISERILEIKATWPPSWGPLTSEAASIGVVTPYSDQVMVIRSELKRSGIYGVSVESVNNVQGKQYRVLILSTVRSRTVYDTVVIGGTGKKNRDYGFLSDLNLLNTAITRSQSLLAVVGDPMTLCSTGKCRQIWEAYIRLCNKTGSLYGITMSGIEEVVYGRQTKNIYRLNPNADEFLPISENTEQDKKDIPPISPKSNEGYIAMVTVSSPVRPQSSNLKSQTTIPSKTVTETYLTNGFANKLGSSNSSKSNSPQRVNNMNNMINSPEKSNQENGVHSDYKSPLKNNVNVSPLINGTTKSPSLTPMAQKVLNGITKPPASPIGSGRKNIVEKSPKLPLGSAYFPSNGMPIGMNPNMLQALAAQRMNLSSIPNGVLPPINSPLGQRMRASLMNGQPYLNVLPMAPMPGGIVPIPYIFPVQMQPMVRPMPVYPIPQTNAAIHPTSDVASSSSSDPATPSPTQQSTEPNSPTKPKVELDPLDPSISLDNITSSNAPQRSRMLGMFAKSSKENEITSRANHATVENETTLKKGFECDFPPLGWPNTDHDKFSAKFKHLNIAENSVKN